MIREQGLKSRREGAKGETPPWRWEGLAEGGGDMDIEPLIGVSGLFQGTLKPQVSQMIRLLNTLTGDC